MKKKISKGLRRKIKRQKQEIDVGLAREKISQEKTSTELKRVEEKLESLRETAEQIKEATKTIPQKKAELFLLRLKKILSGSESLQVKRNFLENLLANVSDDALKKIVNNFLAEVVDALKQEEAELLAGQQRRVAREEPEETPPAPAPAPTPAPPRIDRGSALERELGGAEARAGEEGRTAGPVYTARAVAYTSEKYIPQDTRGAVRGEIEKYLTQAGLDRKDLASSPELRQKVLSEVSGRFGEEASAYALNNYVNYIADAYKVKEEMERDREGFIKYKRKIESWEKPKESKY